MAASPNLLPWFEGALRSPPHHDAGVIDKVTASEARRATRGAKESDYSASLAGSF